MNQLPQKINRALISVSDKSGLDVLARALNDKNVEIISTGGTRKFIEDLGIPVRGIEEITGNPECFGGRVKTLSYQVSGALLANREKLEDRDDLEKLNIQPIDLVVCNLYPFEKATEDKVDESQLIEKIDIGGPTMIRSAAKNYSFLTVLVDPKLYSDFLEEFNENGSLSFEKRRYFAIEAFSRTSQYDNYIANELRNRFLEDDQGLILKRQSLRYGENPHQSAYVLKEPCDTPTIANAQCLQGKQLSFNNYLDADAAWKCSSDLKQISTIGPSQKEWKGVVVVKHNLPCGVGWSSNNLESLNLAWEGDSVSAFGSVISFTDIVDESCAQWLSDKFIEIVIAPGFSSQAKEIFSKKKNLRLLVVASKDLNKKEIVKRSISGGTLIQDEDQGLDPEIQSMTEKEFPKEMKSLSHFGIIVNKYLKSNAVALVGQSETKSFQLIGAGMGQPNRIDSLRLLASPRALEKRDHLSDLLLVSDAFFPFADSIDACDEFGIKYIIQPGGSIRDQEVISACNQKKIAMAFTGRRHFRH